MRRPYCYLAELTGVAWRRSLSAPPVASRSWLFAAELVTADLLRPPQRRT